MASVSRRSNATNLAPLMHKRLSRRTLELLAAAGRAADYLGLQVYAVGGFVRDLLLHRDNEDVDLLVEGPGIAFARHLSRLWGAGVQTHERFGTATLRLDWGGKVDVAMARLETYSQPAALPQVAPAGLAQDLRRRDFTINAMAIHLNPGTYGHLADPLDGRADLEAGRIRILHPGSFEDDPTRIFRAVRFEQRFGFRLEPVTARCLRDAVRGGLIGRLSRPRVLREVLLLLGETDPSPAFRRLSRLGVLGQVHPLLEDPRKSTRWLGPCLKALAAAERGPGRPVDRRLLLLMALLDVLPLAETEAWVREYQVPRDLKSRLLLQKRQGEPARLRLEASRAPGPGHAANWFEGLPDEVLLFTLAKVSRKPALARWMKRLLTERGTATVREKT